MKSNLEHLSNCFCKGLHYFIIPPAMFQFSALPILIICLFKDVLVGSELCPVVKTCSFLITNDTELSI